MRRLHTYVLIIAIGGCASAKVDNGNGPADGNGQPQDSSQQTADASIDAPAIDAAPVAVTLGQTTSTAIVTGNSFACHLNNVTRENSYYRVFAPADNGVANALHVTKVTFSVERAQANAGTQAAQLKVGKYGVAAGGTSVDLNQITPVAAQAITIPNGNGTTVQVPIVADIPAGSNMIVELAIPDGTAAGNIFFIGTNGAGETKPGYIRAPTCNVTSPISMKSLGAAQSPPLPEADIIITVDGTH